MGFRHGQFLNDAGADACARSWDGGRAPWRQEFAREARPLGDLYLTLLRPLGAEAESFACCTTGVAEV